jgi:prepilin peptidase CpaA
MEAYLYIPLALGLLACAITDTRSHRIPNAVTFPLMALALVVHASVAGWDGIFFSMKGVALGLGLFCIPYLLGGMGAGDVKLMMAVGAVIGSRGILSAFIYIAVIGGVFALLALVRRQGLAAFTRRHFQSLRDFFFTGYYASPNDMTIANKRARFGYGIPIALGTFAYLLQTHFGTLVP